MRLFTLVSAPFLLASSCFAAEAVIQLEVMAGKVLKQTTAGFAPAKSGDSLQSGETLMLREGAAAMLNATETGCFVSLRKPGVYIVPDLTDCVPGAARVLPAQAQIEPASGSYEPAYPPPPLDSGIGLLPPPPPPVAPAASSGLIAAGAFVSVAAAVTLYTMVIQDDPVPVSAH